MPVRHGFPTGTAADHSGAAASRNRRISVRRASGKWTRLTGLGGAPARGTKRRAGCWVRRCATSGTMPMPRLAADALLDPGVGQQPAESEPQGDAVAHDGECLVEGRENPQDRHHPLARRQPGTRGLRDADPLLRAGSDGQPRRPPACRGRAGASARLPGGGQPIRCSPSPKSIRARSARETIPSLGNTLAR
jgi:hypothetical protein